MARSRRLLLGLGLVVLVLTPSLASAQQGFGGFGFNVGGGTSGSSGSSGVSGTTSTGARVPATADEQKNIKLNPAPPVQVRPGALPPLPPAAVSRPAVLEALARGPVLSAAAAAGEARQLERQLADPATPPARRAEIATRLSAVRSVLAADEADRRAAGLPAVR